MQMNTEGLPKWTTGGGFLISFFLKCIPTPVQASYLSIKIKSNGILSS